MTFQVSRGKAWNLPAGLEESANARLCSPRWRQQLVPASGAPVGSFLLPGSAHRERSSYGGPSLLLVCLPIMVPCLSGSPRLLPSTPSVAVARPLQAVSAPNPGPLSGTELRSLSFNTQCPTSLTEEYLRLESAGWQCRPSVQFTFYFAFHRPVAALPLLGSETPPFQSNFSTGEEPSQGAATFPPSQLPLQGAGPILIPSFSFSFCLTQLHGGFCVILDV